MFCFVLFCMHCYAGEYVGESSCMCFVTVLKFVCVCWLVSLADLANNMCRQFVAQKQQISMQSNKPSVSHTMSYTFPSLSPYTFFFYCIIVIVVVVVVASKATTIWYNFCISMYQKRLCFVGWFLILFVLVFSKKRT